MNSEQQRKMAGAIIAMARQLTNDYRDARQLQAEYEARSAATLLNDTEIQATGITAQQLKDAMVAINRFIRWAERDKDNTPFLPDLYRVQ